jgi:hypothetical protein
VFAKLAGVAHDGVDLSTLIGQRAKFVVTEDGDHQFVL